MNTFERAVLGRLKLIGKSTATYTTIFAQRSGLSSKR